MGGVRRARIGALRRPYSAQAADPRCLFGGGFRPGAQDGEAGVAKVRSAARNDAQSMHRGYRSNETIHRRSGPRGLQPPPGPYHIKTDIQDTPAETLDAGQPRLNTAPGLDVATPALEGRTFFDFTNGHHARRAADQCCGH